MTVKILVVSDTHGRSDTLQRCIDISAPFDIIIHCGDGVRDIRSADTPENSIVYAVAGNTDIYSSPDEENTIIENINNKGLISEDEERKDRSGPATLHGSPPVAQQRHVVRHVPRPRTGLHLARKPRQLDDATGELVPGA